MALEFIKAHSTSEEIRPVINNAIDTLHDSNSLIREAKKFESINQGELKPFEICKTLAICVDVFKNEYPDIAIESEGNVSEAVVKADTYVADLFSILLENAVQHNPKQRRTSGCKYRRSVAAM
ncbi:MAG: hypothetical protein R6V83_10055 [Candidatus Thorarchaeota archaeon]